MAPASRPRRKAAAATGAKNSSSNGGGGGKKKAAAAGAAGAKKAAAAAAPKSSPSKPTAKGTAAAAKAGGGTTSSSSAKGSATGKGPRYFLMKSEPDTFSLDNLAALPKQVSCWEGVRNYQVRRKGEGGWDLDRDCIGARPGVCAERGGGGAGFFPISGAVRMMHVILPVASDLIHPSAAPWHRPLVVGLSNPLHPRINQSIN